MHHDTEQIMEKLDHITMVLAQINKERFAEQYLDDNELCSLFKITRKTAKTWRDSGQLPYAQLGKRIYYRNKDIETMFDMEVKKPKPFTKRGATSRKRFKPNLNGDGWKLPVYGRE